MILDLFELRETSEVNIEGKLLPCLSTLNLSGRSIKEISVRNLKSVENFTISIAASIDETMSRKFFDHLPNIQELTLKGRFSNLNLDSLINLKNLTLYGIIIETEFNFDLFKNICKQLENLNIYFYDIDYKGIADLFSDNRFDNMNFLSITIFKFNKLERKFIDRFPMLREFHFNSNKLRTIDFDAFSNSKQLEYLSLRSNCIKTLNRRYFSELGKLTTLDLSYNQLKSIGKNMFSSLKKLESLRLSYNKISRLDPESFNGLKNLKSFKIDNNKLSKFDLKILDYLVKIEFINLENNSIENKEEVLISKRLIDFKI